VVSGRKLLTPINNKKPHANVASINLVGVPESFDEKEDSMNSSLVHQPTPPNFQEKIILSSSLANPSRLTRLSHGSGQIKSSNDLE
jgi:hypothetical protein